jgi:hypothetical protein
MPAQQLQKHLKTYRIVKNLRRMDIIATSIAVRVGVVEDGAPAAGQVAMAMNWFAFYRPYADPNTGATPLGFCEPAAKRGGLDLGVRISVVSYSDKQEEALSTSNGFAQPGVAGPNGGARGYSAHNRCLNDPDFDSAPFAGDFLERWAGSRICWQEPASASFFWQCKSVA